MSKELLISFSIPILCLFSGCYETYMGLDMDLSGVDMASVDERLVTDEFLPVRVALNDPSYKSVTRAMGAFDASRSDSTKEAMWKRADFYLFAFRADSVLTSYSTTRLQDPNACLLDNERTWMEDPNSMILEMRDKNKYGKPIYWNDAEELIPYDFFGYYVDDAKIQRMSRNDQDITITMKIDGYQDLLCGKASLTSKQKEQIEASANPYSMRKYSFSAYTARRNLFPVLHLHHQLSRFRFTIYPSDDRCLHITLDSIKVEAFSEVDMIVAHRDSTKLGIQASRNREWMHLRNQDNDFRQLTYKSGDEYLPCRLPWHDSLYNVPAYSRPSIVCGESMMIPADSIYRLRAYTTQYHTETGVTAPHEYEDTIRLSGGLKFIPGGYYNIRMTVGGMQQVVVSASIIGWQQGDSIYSVIKY